MIEDLRDTVVFFPETAEGFIDLTQWVRYLTTVRDEHFSRELKKLTDQVPGRIEVQIQQVGGTQFYKRTTFIDLDGSGTNPRSPNFGERGFVLKSAKNLVPVN